MALAAKSFHPELLVVGGGSAGCAAAVAAARRGCKVLLVEEGNGLGGVSSSGGVGEWFASLDGLGDIFDRVLREMESFGARFGTRYNCEYLKFVWQMLVEEAGVEVLLHTTLTDAHVQNGRPVRAVFSSCSVPINVEADYFVDTTGEGDFGALAGAEFMEGDPQTGLTLHMTLTAVLTDTGKPVKPYLPAGIPPIRDDGSDFPGLGFYMVADGRLYCNATKVMGHDPTDPQSLSAAEFEARRQLMRVVHYIQRMKHPTYALSSSGARIGIREGRRIVGDYVLTEPEIVGERSADFDDGVAVATAQIDFHSLTEPGHGGRRQSVEPYAIPFRCLVVKGFPNILAAGKCISVDQVVHSSSRMTPTCVGMGQAVGTAAAMAVRSGHTDIRQVQINALRTNLAADGVELDPVKHKPFPPRKS